MSKLTKAFGKMNAFIYQATKGRLGSKMGKQSVLLLHTTGRKSGKSFSTPLSYYRDGSNYLIVASNWGKEVHPDWFLNLERHPRTAIQVKNSTLQVEAHPAEGEEYQRLWEAVTRQNTSYLAYQKKLTRRIPIVILIPLSEQR